MDVIIMVPIVGANNGDTLKTSISTENIFAFSSRGKMSLTIALGATIVTQPPIA